MNMDRARKLIHRDSAPVLSFSGFGAKKKEERRKSEVATIPKSQPTVQEVSLPKFYVKGIKREGAEEILNNQPVGTFLVRDRETSNSPGSYTLSLRHKGGLKHHKIETHPSNKKIIIAGYERFQFDTLEQLSEFFILSQKKDIALVPYDPVSTQMESMTLGQPDFNMYEEMEGTEVEHNHTCTSEAYQHMCDQGSGPPPLPTRRGNPPGHPASYENLTRQQRSVPQPRISQRNISCENIVEKAVPAPSPTGASSAPPIPPRVAPQNSQSYQNIPAKSPPPQPGSYENTPAKPSPPLPQRGSYQNIPDRPSHGPGYENYGNKPTGYENYFSKSPRPSTPPAQGSLVGSPVGHSYQNLPPKVAPRRATTEIHYSAEQSISSRKPVPIRRVKTDTERDFHARR